MQNATVGHTLIDAIGTGLAPEVDAEYREVIKMLLVNHEAASEASHNLRSALKEELRAKDELIGALNDRVAVLEERILIHTTWDGVASDPNKTRLWLKGEA